MVMLNRKQFSKKFNQIRPGLGDRNSPLWSIEKTNNRKPSKWFLSVPPLQLLPYDTKDQFWHWVNSTCEGQVLCYSSDSDNQEEWWGFTRHKDAVTFFLKFSHAG